MKTYLEQNQLEELESHWGMLIPYVARPWQLVDCYDRMHDPKKLHLDFCDWEDWQWIQDACGVEMPYETAKQIENILMDIIDERVIAIDISGVARAPWYKTDCEKTSLTTVGAVAYNFMPSGIETKPALEIASILKNYGVDIRKLTETKLAAISALSGTAKE